MNVGMILTYKKANILQSLFNKTIEEFYCYLNTIYCLINDLFIILILILKNNLFLFIYLLKKK